MEGEKGRDIGEWRGGKGTERRGKEGDGKGVGEGEEGGRGGGDDREWFSS